MASSLLKPSLVESTFLTQNTREMHECLRGDCRAKSRTNNREYWGIIMNTHRDSLPSEERTDVALASSLQTELFKLTCLSCLCSNIRETADPGANARVPFSTFPGSTAGRTKVWEDEIGPSF